MADRDAAPRLRVEGLSVGYAKEGGAVARVVDDVTFELRSGEIRGLVGESGCGKSTTALAALGYRGRGGVILAGRSLLGGRDLLTLEKEELRSAWGRDIAYISQNAGTSLNPALRVEAHFAQTLARHRGLRGQQLRARAVESLDAVGIPGPRQALRRYPHQFSGGQQQRIALALALACQPQVLVLDEPTTGLDVTTQARISELLRSVVAESGVAVLYVSHDLALLSTLASRVCVMYGGEVVEEGSTMELTARPGHPYTRALLDAVPSVREPRQIAGIPGEPPIQVILGSCSFAPRCRFATDECRSVHPDLVLSRRDRFARCLRLEVVADAGSAPEMRVASEPPGRDVVGNALLSAENLTCSYAGSSGEVTVVRDVSFSIGEAETLGVVGLSGSGKSTLLRAIVGLHLRVSGEVRFRGNVLARAAAKRPREVRRDLQVVFQDPGSSLNPRHTVLDLVERPIRLFRDDIQPRDREAAVAGLLGSVKLSRRLLSRYPWELSGGQQQRVAIARAFATNPALLLCDEVTSSLDVSVQATILELIAKLAVEHETAVIFVSHDLAVVRTVADRAIVMLDGEVVEHAPTRQLFTAPDHPYTRELLSSVPDIGDSRMATTRGIA